MQHKGFTVGELLNLKEYPEQRLLNPFDGAMNVEIWHVGVNEAPALAGDFVRQGELVLTTAIGCKDDEDYLAFMRELKHGGAAAVAVALEWGGAERIPKAALDFAAAEQMPIIWLPWEYRFADIVEKVLWRINSANKHAISLWEGFQRKLLECYLSRADIGQAAKLCAKQFGARTVLVDAAGYVVADSDGRILPGAFISTRGKELAYFAGIESRTRSLGSIYICTDTIGDEELELMRLYSSYASMPLLLWLDKENAAVEHGAGGAGRASEYILAMAQGRYDGSKEADAMARFIGLRPERQHMCLCALLRYNGTDPAHWIGENLAGFSSIVPRLWPGGMITLKNTTLIAFTPRISEVETMAAELKRRLCEEYPGLELIWGVSGAGNATEFAKMCADAELAAKIALWEELGYMPFEGTELYRLIKQGIDSKDVRRITAKRLAPLKAYDATHSGELCRILLTYFQHDKNASETARALHFHRQSLLYKLDRAEELLGFSLTDHRETLMLELCLMADKYSRME